MVPLRQPKTNQSDLVSMLYRTVFGTLVEGVLHRQDGHWRIEMDGSSIALDDLCTPLDGQGVRLTMAPLDLLKEVVAGDERAYVDTLPSNLDLGTSK